MLDAAAELFPGQDTSVFQQYKPLDSGLNPGLDIRDFNKLWTICSNYSRVLCRDSVLSLEVPSRDLDGCTSTRRCHNITSV
jgi:hypothetical protein